MLKRLSVFERKLCKVNVCFTAQCLFIARFTTAAALNPPTYVLFLCSSYKILMTRPTFRHYPAMNPQFQPPQAFPQNRPSPALAQQGNFQNIPLGPSKPGAPVANGPQSNIPSGFPPQGGPFQPPPPGGMRAPPANRGFTGIPPNQLPPQSGNLGQQGVPPQLSKGQMGGGGLAGPPGGNSQGFPPGNLRQFLDLALKKLNHAQCFLLEKCLF